MGCQFLSCIVVLYVFGALFQLYCHLTYFLSSFWALVVFQFLSSVVILYVSFIVILHEYPKFSEFTVSDVHSAHFRDTGWRRSIGCLKLQVSLRKRATNYRALLQKITYKGKASYACLPPCISFRFWEIFILLRASRIDELQVSFAEYCLFYRALFQKRPIIWSKNSSC